MKCTAPGYDPSTLPNWSNALTATLNAWPAMVLVPDASARWVAGAATTLTASGTDCTVPSEAVNVWEPARVNVAANVPWPLVKVESGGSTTPLDVSLEVKCTVPE